MSNGFLAVASLFFFFQEDAAAEGFLFKATLRDLQHGVIFIKIINQWPQAPAVSPRSKYTVHLNVLHQRT